MLNAMAHCNDSKTVDSLSAVFVILMITEMQFKA